MNTFTQELADFIFTSKYARFEDIKKRREAWDESVDRLQNMHLEKFNWLAKEDRDEVIEAFNAVKRKENVPSMRSLQFGGKAVTAHNARLFNCAVKHVDSIRSFSEIFYLLLCGCGVGIGLQDKYLRRLPNLVTAEDKTGTVLTYVIEDTIEGWSDSIEALLSCYFRNTAWTGRKIVFDYSRIRKKGSILKTGGGRAPGYRGLKKAHIKIKYILDFIIEELGQYALGSINAYDILMHLSDAVLSGGIRRSACSVVFLEDDVDMLNAKTYFKVLKKGRFELNEKTNKYEGYVVVDDPSYRGLKIDVEITNKYGDYDKLVNDSEISWVYTYPQRARSNNSVLLLRDKITQDTFTKIFERTRQFGEPGFVFANNEDTLFNPCFEISFIPVYDGVCGVQFCNLSSINGAKIQTKEDLFRAAKNASIIGTLQATYTDFPYLSKAAKWLTEEEALLGVSITGMLDNPAINLDPEIQEQASNIVKAVNEEWAKKLYINPAARTTCIKPEGCLSKETMLVTNKGILSLEEIGKCDGDTWQKHDLRVVTDIEEKNSPKFFVNGEKLTKKIIFNSGFEIEATLNHKFKVIEGEEIIWKTAENFSIGDKVLYRVGGYSNENNEKFKPLEYKKSKFATRLLEIKQPTEINEEIAWFLGLYYGDGSNHTKGIRISGDKRYTEELDKAAEILLKYFGITYTKNLHKEEDDNRLQYCFNSKQLLLFLKVNGIYKERSRNIDIPILIRKSSKAVIEAFVDGLCAADGHDQTPTRSFCTSSKKLSQRLITVLRAIGKDCKVRTYTSKNSFSKNEKYWIQERKSRSGHIEKSNCFNMKLIKLLDEKGLQNCLYDEIVSIQNSKNYTYDIEVEDTHTYLANSFVVHNTSSLVLQSASGIHPHHGYKYFRRVQCNKIDPVYMHFKKYNPHMCEESVWSANKTDDVITFPIEVPPTVIVKNDLTALDHLNIVKNTQKNWVRNGKSVHNKKDIDNNVSCTIIVGTEEWASVVEYLFDNKDYFAAVSFIGKSGDKDYIQAPLENITTEEDHKKWNDIVSNFVKVDYSLLRETSDQTDLQAELVCAGANGCEMPILTN